MKPTPPLTRFIGEAERTLQALLKHQLDRAGLRFEEWVTLTIVSGATAPDKATLLRQIAAAKVVAPGDEADLLHAMIQRGHIEGDSALALSAEGRAVFETSKMPIPLQWRGRHRIALETMGEVRVPSAIFRH